MVRMSIKNFATALTKAMIWLRELKDLSKECHRLCHLTLRFTALTWRWNPTKCLSSNISIRKRGIVVDDCFLLDWSSLQNVHGMEWNQPQIIS